MELCRGTLKVVLPQFGVSDVGNMVERPTDGLVLILAPEVFFRLSLPGLLSKLWGLRDTWRELWTQPERRKKIYLKKSIIFCILKPEVDVANGNQKKTCKFLNSSVDIEYIVTHAGRLRYFSTEQHILLFAAIDSIKFNKWPRCSCAACWIKLVEVSQIVFIQSFKLL